MTIVSRSDKDMELWQSWKTGGDDSALGRLMKNLEPLVRDRARRYQGNLPPSAINAHAFAFARKALDSYDPKFGAKISTHVSNQLMPLSRIVKTHQNFARVPEDRVKLIGNLRTAVEDLKTELNREPTDLELADRLKRPPSQVALMRREAWADVIDAPNVFSQHAMFETSAKGDVLNMLYFELGSKERLVFEHLVGWNGRQPARNNRQISTATGLPEREVEKLRRKITKRVQEVT